MSDLVLLLLGRSPEEPLRWGAFRDGRLMEGGWIENGAALSAIAERAANARAVVALLPGEQAAARRMPSAPRSPAKLRAAATYLMEDELGESADGVMVSVSAANGAAIAIAAKRAVVEPWLAAFAAAAIDCDTLSADYLVLPSSEETATILSENSRIVAALGGTGFAVEEALFSEIAGDILRVPPARVRLLGGDGLQHLLPAESALERLGEASDANVLLAYAGGILAGAPPNFLQRRWFKRKAASAMITPWRRAGALAAGLAVLLFAGAIGDGIRASRIADRWHSAAGDLHEAYFPEAAAADPVAFARERLGSGGGTSFVGLAAQFAKAVEGGEDIQIDRIRFHAARGEFIVSVTSKTDIAIEELKAALAANGVAAADSGGYRNNGEYWNGELTARAQ